MQPFTLRISDTAIADLQDRLARARFPDQAPDAPWAYGSDVSFVQELCEYWQNEFDWRSQEEILNRYEQYRVRLQGIDLHFLKAPGTPHHDGSEPMPLLLCHGWPGSVFEFPKLIERLTQPEKFGGSAQDSITVIAPSLPGYTLSFSAGQRRFSLSDIAGCFAELMTEVLGYSRFGVQGGDWGSFIASLIGHQSPESVIGVHLNMMPLRRNSAHQPTGEDETRYLTKELPAFLREETGYQWIQGTRPQTLAFGLNDSPAGLAAWVVEKFRAWTDCHGNPLNALTRDEMLANISLYWFTECIGASFWPYYDRMHNDWAIPVGEAVTVPVGYAEFPKEIIKPPRSLAESQYSNIQRWERMPRGGHFAALEQPELLATEIHGFFRALTREA